MVGKSTKLSPVRTAETVTSPRDPGRAVRPELDDGSSAGAAPPRAAEPGRSGEPPSARDAPTQVMGPIESQSGVVFGARPPDHIILSAGSTGIGQCLLRNEVVAYLEPASSRELRARVDAHTVDCAACRRWVRHVDDEILDYVGGQRSEDELARMDAHLEACKVCRELMHHVLQGMAQSWPGESRDGGDAGTTFVTGNMVSSRYVIRSFLGRGGMGEVYEAFDRLMDRRIALKTMLCTVGDRTRAARRFKEEVRNAQRVGHPHVCRINDLHEHEVLFGPPLPFFTMEYIDGDRLANRLLQGALPLDDVRVIAHQLLDGLRAAHQRGVLHLDFKSDNVMLRHGSGTPEAVIMDFGLSRVLGSESKLRTSDRKQFAGTLPYMSLEQLECREDLGPGTDIYAFGVVLYEMLTRTLPFDGDTLGAVLLKQLNEHPKPPSRHVPGLSRRLDRFVLTCLKSDPRARYRDAAEALTALEAVGPWFRPPATRAWLWRVGIGLAGAAAAGGLLVVAAGSGPATTDPAASASKPTSLDVDPVTRELSVTPLAAPAAPASESDHAASSTPAASMPASSMPASSLLPSHRGPSLEPNRVPSAAGPTPAAGARAPDARTPLRTSPARQRRGADAARAPGEAPSSPRAEPATSSEPDRGASAAGESVRYPSSSDPSARSGSMPATPERSANETPWQPSRVPKRLRSAPPGAPERDRPQRDR